MLSVPLPPFSLIPVATVPLPRCMSCSRCSGCGKQGTSIGAATRGQGVALSRERRGSEQEQIRCSPCPCSALYTGWPRAPRRERQELKGPPAQARPSDPATGICGSCRWVSSPVQVEGSDLCIVPLVVGEIKKVRGCLLLSCLPRKKGTRQEGFALRKSPGGRVHAANLGSGAAPPHPYTFSPGSLVPPPTQDCQKPPGDFSSPALLPPPCSSGVTNPLSSLSHLYMLPVLRPAPPSALSWPPGAFLEASEKASPLRSLAPWH